VQKYERGANRISASKLYEIARALRVPIAWFFRGPQRPGGRAGRRCRGGRGAALRATFPDEPGGVDLANLFPRLSQRRVRRRLVDLVRSLVEDGEAEATAAEAEG